MNIHVVAILKGAVEGDPTRHLASLLGWDEHVRGAEQAGLVVREPLVWPHVAPSAVGYEFYHRYQLAQLPDGRANQWAGPVVDAAVAAIRDLDQITTREED